MSKTEYRLIAFDMDGTLLNTEKKITEKTLEAIRTAAAAGKETAICTGRSVSELGPYLPQLPEVRYLVCENGAYVFDRKEEKALFCCKFSDRAVKKTREFLREKDVLFMFLGNGAAYSNLPVHPDVSPYIGAVFQPLFEHHMKPVSDVEDALQQIGSNPEKINMYFRTSEERTATYRYMSGFPDEINPVTALDTGVEITPPGVNKGTGLTALCRAVCIPLPEIIFVGDSENDVEALQTAGLALVMRNGLPEVKALADFILPDNDHDGCAEAITKYLMA